MGRLKKTVLIVGGVILLLLAGLVALVHLLVTPERIKGWALPVLQEELRREVSLADVEIGLLSGIALHDLRVRDQDGQNDLLRIESLTLAYRIWPLFGGRLVIDAVVLQRPMIRLVQHADGSMNIADLLDGSAGKAEPEGSSAGSAGGHGIDLLVSKVLLEGGDIKLLRSGAAQDIHLQNLRVLVQNITLQGAFPLDVSFLLEETEFKLAGEFDPSASRGRLDLQIARLDLNRFLPGPAEPEANANASARSRVPAVEPGPVDVPITLDGTLKIGELLYDEVVVKAVAATYRLADNRFQLKELTGQIADGTFRAQADVDLASKGFAYTGNFSLEGVDLQSLVPVLLPRADRSTHGLMQLQFDFSGSGTDPARLVKQLTSTGRFRLDKGKLMGSPLLVGLATFLGNPELKILSFQSLAGEYDLKQGAARISAALDSSKTRLSSSGTVELNGPLDLQLETRLAPDMLRGFSADSPVSRAFTDADGWGVLPLKIGGTISDPTFRLSSAGLKSQAKEQVKQKVQETLQEKLGGQTGEAGKLLDQPLKKLFGQ
ncbi:MAG: AsmA family protein [Desulfuromonadales bacterium]|nr:AsmA family protein [Desulfuromonadales bacterium]